MLDVKRTAVGTLGDMTLREWYAGMALQSVACGIIAERNFGTTPQSLAAAAVEMADALIAELAKKGGE